MSGSWKRHEYKWRIVGKKKRKVSGRGKEGVGWIWLKQFIFLLDYWRKIQKFKKFGFPTVDNVYQKQMVSHLFFNVVILYTFSLPLCISNYNEQKMPLVPKCLETVFGGIQWV